MTPALQYTYTFCGFVKMYCGNTWLAGVILHISTYCVLRMGSHWRKLSFVKQFWLSCCISTTQANLQWPLLMPQVTRRSPNLMSLSPHCQLMPSFVTDYVKSVSWPASQLPDLRYKTVRVCRLPWSSGLLILVRWQLAGSLWQTRLRRSSVSGGNLATPMLLQVS